MSRQVISEPALGQDDAAEERQSVLTVEHLTKRFGPTIAVRDASFTVRAGEVHALVGENGSGKSTLVKILSGVHSPTSGGIHLDGVTRSGFRSPSEAQAAGIVTVFQEVLSVGSRSVLDNLWLGADTTFRTRIPRAERRSRATAMLARLLEHPPALETPVEDLTLSERQVCSIARALLRSPRVLILDEATSALDYDSRSRLFAAIAELRAEGVGVVLITHRMDEIEEIGERITVLRSGVTVGTLDGTDWTTDRLVELMTGGEHLAQTSARAESRARSTSTQPVLTASEVVLAPGRAPLSLQLRAGEMVGLAGLEGQGQDRFLKALAGLAAVDGRIVRHVGSGADATETQIRDHRGAHATRIAYVARERRGESLFEWMSVLDNFSIATVDDDVRRGLLSRKASAARLKEYVGRLSIKTGNTSNAITTLSGGNQQKVILARWLATKPDVLLLNDPTRGIDINAKRDLYRVLGELAAEGTAVVMLSTEVDEHVELMDRVLVFNDHRCVADIPHAELTRQSLVARFFGERADAVHTKENVR